MSSIKILGHEFHPMRPEDYEGLAGAEDGSYMAVLSDRVLVYTPKLMLLSEIYDDGERQRDWKMEEIL